MDMQLNSCQCGGFLVPGLWVEAGGWVGTAGPRQGWDRTGVSAQTEPQCPARDRGPASWIPAPSWEHAGEGAVLPS